MKFSDAISELKNGKKIFRPSWKDTYLKITDESKVVECFTLSTSHFHITCDIILSNDWIVFDDDGGNLENVAFENVINFLSKGKNAKLGHWEDSFIELDQYTRTLVLKFYTNSPFVPGYEDFISEDWNIS